MAGRSACLVCGRMNLCSGTAGLSIRNTDIKTSAGFPGSSKTYGVLHLYTTGQILTYGARIIASVMITIIYMSKPTESSVITNEPNNSQIQMFSNTTRKSDDWTEDKYPKYLTVQEQGQGDPGDLPRN